MFKTSTLAGGLHNISLIATNPVGKKASDGINLGVCTWQTPENFNTEIEGSSWKIYGDAYWDSDETGAGWLEMTGLDNGQQGAIFNIQEMVTPGDVQINFKIRSGGGSGGGADGFAMSVIDVSTLEELDEICGKYRISGLPVVDENDPPPCHIDGLGVTPDLPLPTLDFTARAFGGSAEFGLAQAQEGQNTRIPHHPEARHRPHRQLRLVGDADLPRDAHVQRQTLCVRDRLRDRQAAPWNRQH